MSLHKFSKANNDGRIRAVIFDLDDTLISEYEFVVSGYRFVSEKLAGRLDKTAPEIEDRLWELSKETYSRAFNRLFDSYGVSCSEEELKELISAYRNHPADTRFYPDVAMTLTGLKDRGILMGIISDGDPGRQRNKIRSAVAGIPDDLHKYPKNKGDDAGLHNGKARIESKGLHNLSSGMAEDDLHDKAGSTSSLHKISNKKTESESFAGGWFDEVILNDEFGGIEYRKPNPKGFREMARRLGVEPSEMIYIGDNPAKDFHISVELPVRTVRIVRENGIYTNREYLDGIKETWRIDSLTDILGIVDKNNEIVNIN